MQPLRYSINVTLDGCVDHRVGIPNEGVHRHAMENIQRNDAMILGRVTYVMMEEAWRDPVGMPDWTLPFAEAIGASKKYVASRTLSSVDWNSELLSGDVVEAVQALKNKPGRGLGLGGVRLPLALAELIDEFEFVVHPMVAGHGPRLLDGLPHPLTLELASSEDLGDGVVAHRYVRLR